MIIDQINNAALYFPMGERIEKALKYLSTTDFTNLEPGKYEVDGRLIYALVQHYDTLPREKCELEAHKEYVDVQYVTAGEECIGFEPLGEQPVISPYDMEKDYWLFAGNPSMVPCRRGMFVILFPSDLHMPRVVSGKSMKVRKVVVKVKV